MTDGRKALIARADGSSGLLAGARHLRQIVAGMSDGVILIGTDRTILWANPCALRMHGVSRVADLGLTVADYRKRFELHYRNRHLLPEGSHPMERLLAGEAVDGLIVDVTPASSPDVRWTHRVRSLVLRDDDGKPDCLVLILDDETERYNAEDRFERAFGANPAPAAILGLRDLRFLRINKGFTEMTGYAERDVVGRSIYEIDVLEGAVRRELAIDRLKAGRTIPQMEALLQLPDGGDKGVIVAGQPIEIADLHCMLFTFADLDDRRKAETALRQSEERFERAFRLAPVPTLIASRDGFRILFVNDAFLHKSGYTKDAIVGREAGELPLWADENSAADLETALGKNDHARDLRLQLRTMTGDLVEVVVSAASIEMDGNRCMIIVAKSAGERDSTSVEIADAIGAVMRDTTWFTDVVLERLARTRRPIQPDVETSGLNELPPRAREVLGMICQGLDDGEIAAAMSLSRNTIRNHVASLYGRTGSNNRSRLVVWARERGLTGRPR